MHNDIMAARKRVMIVSHETRSGLDLADWLASDGYEVAIAHQADEASEQLSVMRPDGIVLDLQLPIARGLEILRLIRVRCPHVPVFTIEQSARRVDREPTPGVQASSYFLKPFQLPLMRTLLDVHVRGIRT